MMNKSLLHSIFLITLIGIVFLSPSQSISQQSQSQQIQWSDIKTMQDAPVDSYFYLQAKIKSVKSPDAGSRQPWILYVEDNTGIARVVIFQDIWNQIEKPEQYEPGIIIQVFGKTNDYKDQRQLIAEGPRWIRMAPGVMQIPDSARRNGNQSDQNNYTEMSIGGVNIKTIGQTVTIRGIVQQVEESTQTRVPTKVLLADKTGQIEVVYWQEVSGNLALDHQPVVGQPVEFKGTIGEYQNRMQLRVDNPGHVKVLNQLSMRMTPDQKRSKNPN